MKKPHIEITNEDARCVADGAKHCELISAGWFYSENEDGTEGFYSMPNAFDAGNLCLSDAYQLYKMIQGWAKEDD